MYHNAEGDVFVTFRLDADQDADLIRALPASRRSQWIREKLRAGIMVEEMVADAVERSRK